MTRRRLGFAIVVAVAAFLLAGRVVAGWLVEFRWYEALGATDVFWSAVTNLALLRTVAFLAAGLVFFLNLYAVRYSIASVILPRRVGNLEIGEELSGRTLVLIVLAISVILALVLAFSLNDWTSLELIRHGEPFRESDPFFQSDLAFWVYWLPLEESFHAWMAIVLLAATLVVVFLYALTPSLRWEGGRLRVSGHVRRHLLLLCSLFLLLLAWSYRLDAFGLLLDGAGVGRAFQALDHRIGIPSRLVLAMASVVCAMLVAWAGWVGQLRLVLAASGVLALIAVSARQLVPALATRYGTGDPETRERPYRATRAGFSRRAFDVDRITVADSIPGASAKSGVAVAVWDAEAIRRAASLWSGSAAPQGTLGWSIVEGRPVAVIARPPSGPDPSTRWTVYMSDATSAGEDGQLPRSRSPGDGVQATPPAIVGDSVFDAGVIVDSLGAMAAPALDTRASRILHAWGLQNPRLLDPPIEGTLARIVRVRDARERVQRIFPWFLLGNRVTPVVHGDSLLWTIHLYSASSHYPLSEPIVLPDGDVTYLRHAGIAVVNAHTGRLFAIRVDDPDPVARSWIRRFPSLFIPASAVQPALLGQLPPPTDGVLTQARIYARFGKRGDVAPPSLLARSHGADSGFAYPSLAPFVHPVRQRLATAYPVLDATEVLRGVVVGSGAVDVSTAYHPSRAGRSWRGLLEEMRHTLDSASTRATPRATALVRGPVRAFLLGGVPSLLQTAYEWPPGQGPLLRWVAVWNGDAVRVGRSMESALGLPESAAVGAPLTSEAFRLGVAELYRAMGDALDQRDLVAFAAAWEQLGTLLRRSARAP